MKIALDDFGTGYSSLYHLRELSFDKLKIDRSYVRSLNTMSNERAKLVDAIIQLGASLGLQTTAEGIEIGGEPGLAVRPGLQFRSGLPLRRAMPKDEMDDILAAADPVTQRSVLLDLAKAS